MNANEFKAYHKKKKHGTHEMNLIRNKTKLKLKEKKIEFRICFFFISRHTIIYFNCYIYFNKHT